MFIRAPPPPKQHTQPLCEFSEPLCGKIHLNKLLENNCQNPLFFIGSTPRQTTHTTTVWFHETTVFEMENHSVSPMFIKVPAIKDLTSSEITLKPYKYHSHHKYYRKFVTYWNGGTYTLTLTRFVQISKIVNLSKDTLIL